MIGSERITGIKRAAGERARRLKGEGGFTLIELLVVITILGVLAAIVVFSTAGINDRGQTSACKIDTRTISTAEEANFAKNGAYVDEATLVNNGFLSQQSTLHDLKNVTASSYDVFTLTGDTRCGTADTKVNGTTVF